MSFLADVQYAEFRDRMMTDIEVKIAAFGIKRRWISRSEYAAYFGICEKTVERAESRLRRLGAVIGDGKLTRYDKTFDYMGNRRI